MRETHSECCSKYLSRKYNQPEGSSLIKFTYNEKSFSTGNKHSRGGSVITKSLFWAYTRTSHNLSQPISSFSSSSSSRRMTISGAGTCRYRGIGGLWVFMQKRAKVLIRATKPYVLRNRPEKLLVVPEGLSTRMISSMEWLFDRRRTEISRNLKRNKNLMVELTASSTSFSDMHYIAYCYA